MQNTYYEQFMQFINDYKSVREYFGLKDIIQGYRILNYDKYIGENEEVVKEIKKEMGSSNGAALLIGFTGSGKSHCLISCANDLKGRARGDGKVPIFVKINPKKKQCEQEEASYENVVAIFGAKSFDKQDILNHKILSIVYDKSQALLNFLEKNEDIQKKYYVVLIIDECHSLISNQYRKRALCEIQKLVEYVKEQGGNIIYTTATFSTCCVLDVNHIYFCCPKRFGNLGRIEEITCPNGVTKESFIYNNIINVIRQGFTPCVRLNDINLMQSLQENFLRQKGMNIAIVNASNQNESDVAKAIVEESCLPGGYDGYIFTCLLDESVNLKGIKDSNGKIKPSNKLCPMFFLDALSTNVNMDNISQFVARFRFPLQKMVLMIDKHKYDATPLETLKRIAYLNGQRYTREYESFVMSLKAARLRYGGDMKRIKKEITWLLEQEDDFGRPNHRGNLFSYENDEIYFDINDCFNRIYNEYMSQYLTHDVERRKFLGRYFQCKVRRIKYIEEENVEEVVNYSSLRFEHFCDEVVSREDIQGMIDYDFEGYIKTLERDDKFGEYMNQIEQDKRYEDLVRLSRFKPVSMGVQDVKSLSTKEVKNKIKEYEKMAIAHLNKSEVGELDQYVLRDIAPTSKKVAQLMDSDYVELIKKANKVGISTLKFIEIIKNRSYKECVEYIDIHKIIRNNRRYQEGEVLPGRSGGEQAFLICTIDCYKKGKTQVTMNENDIDTIKTLMCRKTHEEWSFLRTKRYISKVFHVEEDKKNKKLVVRDLRLQH